MTDYDQLLDLIRTRRSIRRFTAQPVNRDSILKLLEAARWAPSNHNRQPWRFIVVEDAAQMQALAQNVTRAISARLKSLPPIAAGYAGELGEHAIAFAQASVVVIVLHKPPIKLSAALLEGVPNPALVSGEPLSTAMAVQNMLLAAHALGIGGCVLTAPLLVPEAIAATVVLPPGLELTCLLALGYPAEAPAAPRRKDLEQLVQFSKPRTNSASNHD